MSALQNRLGGEAMKESYATKSNDTEKAGTNSSVLKELKEYEKQLGVFDSYLNQLEGVLEVILQERDEKVPSPEEPTLDARCNLGVSLNDANQAFRRRNTSLQSLISRIDL